MPGQAIEAFQGLDQLVLGFPGREMRDTEKPGSSLCGGRVISSHQIADSRHTGFRHADYPGRYVIICEPGGGVSTGRNNALHEGQGALLRLKVPGPVGLIQAGFVRQRMMHQGQHLQALVVFAEHLWQATHGKPVEYYAGAIGHGPKPLVQCRPGLGIRARKAAWQSGYPSSAAALVERLHQFAHVTVAAGVLVWISRDQELDESGAFRFRHGSWPRQCGTQTV